VAITRFGRQRGGSTPARSSVAVVFACSIVLAGSVVVPSWHGVGKAPSTKKAYGATVLG
jgi:hypothetical protein